MTMVERVARAIEDEGPVGCCTISPEKAMSLARAAIEAMREPSQMMQSAALPYVMRQHQTRDVWRSMIDAALTE